MPNIYYLNDHGTVIFRNLDQKVYTKIGTRNDVLPNASWGVGDVGSIGPSTTFNVADAQAFNQYNAQQFAVADNLYRGNATWGDTNYHEIIASSPVAGVIRFGALFAGSSIRVNGVDVYNNAAGLSAPSWNDLFAYPVNIDAGDVIEGKSNSAGQAFHWAIIPFQWPQP